MKKYLAIIAVTVFLGGCNGVALKYSPNVSQDQFEAIEAQIYQLAQDQVSLEKALIESNRLLVGNDNVLAKRLRETITYHTI